MSLSATHHCTAAVPATALTMIFGTRYGSARRMEQTRSVPFAPPRPIAPATSPRRDLVEQDACAALDHHGRGLLARPRVERRPGHAGGPATSAPVTCAPGTVMRLHREIDNPGNRPRARQHVGDEARFFVLGVDGRQDGDRRARVAHVAPRQTGTTASLRQHRCPSNSTLFVPNRTPATFTQSVRSPTPVAKVRLHSASAAFRLAAWLKRSNIPGMLAFRAWRSGHSVRLGATTDFRHGG